MSTGPVETKVTAATLGASASAVVLWALETYVFTPGAVPAPVAGFAELIILAGCTFGAGWLARHTPRSDPDALPPDSANRPPLR
jgi:hypothetical protein